MVHLLNECFYKKHKNYVFKEQIFLNNNNKLVYCLIAVKRGVIECLLQSLKSFDNQTKDLVIKDYLNYKGE